MRTTIIIIKIIIYSTPAGSARRPPEREAQQTSATSPLGGRDLDHLSRKLPYPRSPALCRKDTTYPCSNRLRSSYQLALSVHESVSKSIWSHPFEYIEEFVTRTSIAKYDDDDVRSFFHRFVKETSIIKYDDDDDYRSSFPSGILTSQTRSFR